MSNDNLNNAVNKVQGVAKTKLTNLGNKLENELGPALSSAISSQLSQPNNGASDPPKQNRPRSPQNGPSEEDVKNSIENLKVLLQKYVDN